MGQEYAQTAPVGPDMSDSLNSGPESYGNDPGIQLIDRGVVKIDHKAKYKTNYCYCDNCNGSLGRKYFWVLENAIEQNDPYGFRIACFTLPPNCCCIGMDFISKQVNLTLTNSKSNEDFLRLH
jgi:hypothetical protein